MGEAEEASIRHQNRGLHRPAGWSEADKDAQNGPAAEDEGLGGDRKLARYTTIPQT